MADDGLEQDGWNGKIVRRSASIFEFLPKSGKGRQVLIVAVNVTQQAQQFGKGHGVNAAVFFQAVFGPGTKLLQIPSGFGNTDYGNVEVSTLCHRLQRGENLLVCEIAGSSKENQRIRLRISHECSP